ncbi:unnamed protein product, partial [Mesorhabditis spiculigera]
MSIRSPALVAGALLLLCSALMAEELPDDAAFQREARNFPYSINLVKLLPPTRERVYVANDARSLKAAEDDLNSILESLDANSPSRKQKRYACRFKFCRIFDA